MPSEPNTTTWQPIETAPKSAGKDGVVKAVYILAFCPDEGADPKSCISVVWWEPFMRNGRGQWQGETCDTPMRPTHWMPLPEPPL